MIQTKKGKMINKAISITVCLFDQVVKTHSPSALLIRIFSHRALQLS